MSFLNELWEFLRERKKFWLLPIIFVLLLMGGLIVLTQGSAVAPFVYTLFWIGNLYTFWASRPTIMTARQHSFKMVTFSPPLRRSDLHEENTMLDFPSTPSGIAWMMRGSLLKKLTMWFSMTSRFWNSSGCWKPTWPLPREDLTPSEKPSPYGSRRNCFRKNCCVTSCINADSRATYQISFCFPHSIHKHNGN